MSYWHTEQVVPEVSRILIPSTSGSTNVWNHSPNSAVSHPRTLGSSETPLPTSQLSHSETVSFKTAQKQNTFPEQQE